VPNRASRGRCSEVELGRFLMEVPKGPQHQALRSLVASLLEDNDAAGG
jgi:hypothetical protein